MRSEMTHQVLHSVRLLPVPEQPQLLALRQLVLVVVTLAGLLYLVPCKTPTINIIQSSSSRLSLTCRVEGVSDETPPGDSPPDCQQPGLQAPGEGEKNRVLQRL